MALDRNSVHKPFRKLRKLLKNFPGPPSPDDVHDVRTHTRRIEAITSAFQLDDKKSGRDLIKSLTPIRKAAGDVRDMDVLSDFAASLKPDRDGNCRLKLMKHLAGKRMKAAAKLEKKVSANAKRARIDLKQSSKFAEAGLEDANSGGAKPKDVRESRKKSADSMASSLQIEQELRDWPKLTHKNIHPFRLKVKQLRYVLQLSQNKDSNLIDALGEVKDQIGLWHDWDEFSAIAAKVLKHGAGCSIGAQIRSRTKKEFEKALESANNLRQHYLPNEAGRGSRKKGVVTELHPVMIKAALQLAS
jgi:CHAD domain-containing protein